MSFLWNIGDAVRVTGNVRNDGTFAGAQRGDLLIRRGRVGTVVDVGLFLQTQVIYTVHFLEDDRLVGCREEELIGADEAWVPSLFESREHVRAARTLVLAGGALRIERGCPGEVLRVLRDESVEEVGENAVVYHVHFESAPGRVLAVPEALLVEATAAPPRLAEEGSAFAPTSLPGGSA